MIFTEYKLYFLQMQLVKKIVLQKTNKIEHLTEILILTITHLQIDENSHIE